MIIELEQKFRRQLDANEQPEAFFSGWRLIHLSLRHFLINTLCDDAAQQRVIDSLSSDSLPSEEQRTTRSHPNVKMVSPLGAYILKEYADKVNKATERELFTKYTGLITGDSLADTIQSRSQELWDEYKYATTRARHHVAHGRALSTRNASGMTYQQLTESLIQIWSIIRCEYRGDKFFEHTMMDGPLPPFVEYSYDPTSGKLTISENPRLITPEY